MTKLSLAKYLKQIQGTLSKTLITFRTWKERQVLEDYPKPTYTRTSKQDEIRSWYKQGCEEWKKLTPEQKEAYKEKASKLGLTAFNVFMSEWLKLPKAVFKYKVTINNTQLNQTLTDYQIKLVVNGDSIFFNDFNNDHKYLEVYDTDQATQLSFWVEQWDPTNKNAIVWIKVPSIPASATKDIYLKFNPGRTSYLSNPDAVFLFFDDFDGSALDTTKWDYAIYTGSITVSGGKVRIQGYAYIMSKTSLSGNWQFEAMVNFPSGVASSRQRIQLLNVNNGGIVGFDYGLFDADGSTLLVYWNGNIGRLIPQNQNIMHYSRYYNNIFYWIWQNLQGQNLYSNSATPLSTPVKIWFRIGESTTTLGGIDIYYVRARKYVSPEPTTSYSRIV
jgi:hypothetical protein